MFHLKKKLFNKFFNSQHIQLPTFSFFLDIAIHSKITLEWKIVISQGLSVNTSISQIYHYLSKSCFAISSGSAAPNTNVHRHAVSYASSID